MGWNVLSCFGCGQAESHGSIQLHTSQALPSTVRQGSVIQAPADDLLMPSRSTKVGRTGVKAVNLAAAQDVASSTRTERDSVTARTFQHLPNHGQGSTDRAASQSLGHASSSHLASTSAITANTRSAHVQSDAPTTRLRDQQEQPADSFLPTSMEPASLRDILSGGTESTAGGAVQAVDLQANNGLQVDNAALASTLPSTASAVPHTLGSVDVVVLGLVPMSRHGRGLSAAVADAYEDGDLDDNWGVVLGDLDKMLAYRGMPPLSTAERSVAIKQLIYATGTRGVKLALQQALDGVVAHRRLNPNLLLSTLPSAPTTAASADASAGGSGQGPSGSLHACTPSYVTEEEYETEELDDGWRSVLADLDAKLVTKALPPLGPADRAVAIKTLICATGTRGVEVALNMALEDVCKARQLAAQSAPAV